jgi:lipopolysaccharide biosynthesis glycosyltransferase
MSKVERTSLKANQFIAVAVDHRNRREDEQSLCKFIYPQDAFSLGLHKTLGKFGADFAELRAWEYSLKDEFPTMQAILHYRRVFIFPSNTHSNPHLIRNQTWEGNFLFSWNWAFTPELGWSEGYFNDLDSTSVYLPCEIDNTILGAKSNYLQFIKSHPEVILDVLRKTWSEAGEFIEFLKTTTKTTPYNMIIASYQARKLAFDWLIPILNRMEPHLIQLSKDPYQKRWPGFLAERLLTYYWDNIAKEKIVRVEIGRLDDSLEVSHYVESKSGHTAMFASDKNYLLLTLASMEVYASRGFKAINFLVLFTEWDEALGERHDYVSYLMNKYPQHEFHLLKLEKSLSEIGFKDSSLWPKATYLRFATLLICGDPIVYWFDGDTIPICNIDEISIHLTENAIVSMSPDVFLLKRRLQHIWDQRFDSETWAQYYERILPVDDFPLIYQAGVLVFANDRLKSTFYLAELIKTSMTNSYPGAPDQDIMNLVVKDKISLLPLEYNYVNHRPEDVARNCEIVGTQSKKYLDNWASITTPKVIHFTGEGLPKPFKSVIGVRLGFQYLLAVNSTVAGQVMLAQNHVINGANSGKSLENQNKVKIYSKNKIFGIAQRVYFTIPPSLRNNSKLVRLRVKIYNWLKK